MLNSTKEYHTNRLTTLGWELTVCNALHPAATPVRKALVKDDSFGHLLFDYLATFFPVSRITRILEIGGGYGYLMRDFLDRNPELVPVMLDISPQLLEKQKETLRGTGAIFREEDFLETGPDALRGFDMVIMNENLGDFPTLVDVAKEVFEDSADQVDPDIKKAIRLVKRYALELPEGDTCSLNIGAIEAVEKLCASRIPYIYVGEHSCEASAPPGLAHFLSMKPTGNPERIALMGHDEYTIRFSHIEKVARSHGYECVRGPFADFISPEWTDRLRSVMASRGRYSDEGEMVWQFVGDLYKYEYVLLAGH